MKEIKTIVRKHATMNPSIFVSRMGWGCGYALLPEGHPCYGVHYDTIHEKYDVDVHGGLTYSGWEDGDVGEKLWMIGFDTCHFRDTLESWPEERVREEADRLAFRMYEIWLRKIKLDDDGNT